jgi:hypothetical protein
MNDPELTAVEQKLLDAADRPNRAERILAMVILIAFIVAGSFKILDELGIGSNQPIDLTGVSAGVLLWIVAAVQYAAYRQRQVALSVLRKLRDDKSTRPA